ncbi:hypothetical protein SAY87_001258 [Trapa incisa]|uniref:GTD-binding domain-containing protein n=1 Tax=Trapa incisa TaxID=236973 RepID=A0AAN7JH68_9MYRT|nr:hypothetical protein SAY87_001258 [Trapa incisa]
MSLREFSRRNGTTCDEMKLPTGPSLLIETCKLVSTSNPQNSFTVPEDQETEELFPEDQISEVMLLRELVKSERRRAHTILSDLEKETSAASTAAEEAMSMIIRLQMEKSLVMIEAKQYGRLAEEKQGHDEEVITFLRSTILEMERECHGG